MSSLEGLCWQCCVGESTRCPFKIGAMLLQLLSCAELRLLVADISQLSLLSELPSIEESYVTQNQAHSPDHTKFIYWSTWEYEEPKFSLKAGYLWRSSQCQRSSWNWLSPLWLHYSSTSFLAQSYTTVIPTAIDLMVNIDFLQTSVHLRICSLRSLT